MEQVWKDISLASLHDRPTTTANHPSFQHFFDDPPFNKDSPTIRASLATMFSPTSGPHPQLHSHDRSSTTPPFLSSISSPFNALTTSSVFPSFSNKRAPEKDDKILDRRHKRMMKNRESAVRSRARKQAYIYELELEAAHLRKENDRLRRQQVKFCSAAPAQVPKKHTLSRTSTAPF